MRLSWEQIEEHVGNEIAFRTELLVTSSASDEHNRGRISALRDLLKWKAEKESPSREDTQIGKQIPEGVSQFT